MFHSSRQNLSTPLYLRPLTLGFQKCLYLFVPCSAAKFRNLIKNETLSVLIKLTVFTAI